MSEDFIKVGAVRRHSVRGRYARPGQEPDKSDCFTRLQVATESASKEALTAILRRVHEEAVALAPKRKDLSPDPISGLINGKPEQLWAPRLLKNSIGYYIKGEQKIHGLNTAGGKYTVSEDISEYPDTDTSGLHGFGARKTAGTFQGFVGTFVMHSDYVNWDEHYEYKRLEVSKYNHKERHWEYEEKTKSRDIPDSSAFFTYGAYVEFHYSPFLRPALYTVVDSGECNNIIAELLKRDFRNVFFLDQVPASGRYVSAAGRWV